MQKITPFLWFDNQAEEAMGFYTSIFKDSKVNSIKRYENAGPSGNETVVTGSFQLAGQQFMALNGGTMFKFTPAISLYVDCKDQEEVDYYWEKLLQGGEPMQCGWLTDKFGVSWQIVPSILDELLDDPDPEKSGRAMEAMLKMVKLDIEALKKAHQGQ